MFTKCSFDKAENKLYYYRRRDCIEKLCKKLKGHVIKIINSEKKEEMIPLSYEETRSYNKLEVCHICKKKFCKDKLDEIIKTKKRVRIIVITHEI